MLLLPLIIIGQNQATLHPGHFDSEATFNEIFGTNHKENVKSPSTDFLVPEGYKPRPDSLSYLFRTDVRYD